MQKILLSAIKCRFSLNYSLRNTNYTVHCVTFSGIVQLIINSGFCILSWSENDSSFTYVNYDNKIKDNKCVLQLNHFHKSTQKERWYFIDPEVNKMIILICIINLQDMRVWIYSEGWTNGFTGKHILRWNIFILKRNMEARKRI